VACQKLHTSALIPQVPPIATTPSKHLPQYYFARPAEVVAPELVGGAGEQGAGEVLGGRGGYGSGLRDEP